MRKINKKVAAVAIGAVAFTGTGVAYAFWTTTGGGTGAATTGDVVGVTIVQTSPPENLYPGGPEGELSGTFNNPNDGPVFVDQVSVKIADGWSEQADGSKPACTATDFQIIGPERTGAEVSADDTSVWGGGTIALLNSGFNQDNCKDVTAPLVYSSN